MNFDLAGIDTKTLSDEGVFMTVKKLGVDTPLLDKDGKPVRIKLLGPDSGVYRDFTRAQVRKRIGRAAEGNDAPDFDQIDAEMITLFTSLTVGWEGMYSPDGEPVPFTPANVRELYDSFPVVREQVDSFVGDRMNFLRAS